MTCLANLERGSERELLRVFGKRLEESDQGIGIFTLEAGFDDLEHGLCHIGRCTPKQTQRSSSSRRRQGTTLSDPERLQLQEDCSFTKGSHCGRVIFFGRRPPKPLPKISRRSLRSFSALGPKRRERELTVRAGLDELWQLGDGDFEPRLDFLQHLFVRLRRHKGDGCAVAITMSA